MILIYVAISICSTSLDYESFQMHNITITVSDRGIIPRQSTSYIIVNVLDYNDNPPEFQQATYNFTVEKESNVGLIIGMVSASDNDSGLNAVVTYQIVSANPSGSFVAIDTQTGQISTLNMLDSNQYSQHKLVVVAIDQGMPSLNGSTTVYITITNRSDNDTVFGKVYSTIKT